MVLFKYSRKFHYKFPDIENIYIIFIYSRHISHLNINGGRELKRRFLSQKFTTIYTCMHRKQVMLFVEKIRTENQENTIITIFRNFGYCSKSRKGEGDENLHY